jgi:hypothetical protein
VGSQQFVRQTPLEQLKLQQALLSTQLAPAGAHTGVQEPVSLTTRGPPVPAPGAPSPAPSSAVTRYQKRDPFAGTAVMVPAVVAVV